jgi:uncharacterized membrane protein YccC
VSRRTPAGGRKPAAGGVVRISDHPRAVEGIRRAKGAGGLAGVGLTFLASSGGGVPGAEVMLRMLLGGLAGWMLAWAVAVLVWRQLVEAEIRASVLRSLELRRQAVEQARALAEERQQRRAAEAAQ